MVVSILDSTRIQGWKIKNPSGRFPPDEIRGSHPIFGQWAWKYQEWTNHSKVHARAKNFSTYYIIYVLRQNYWTFMRFVYFLSFQLISWIRWNLSIDWLKVLGPFWQPRHRSLIRWISAGYPPYGFIIFRPRNLIALPFCQVSTSIHLPTF